MQETMDAQMDEELSIEIPTGMTLHDDERMEVEQEHERDDIDTLNTPMTTNVMVDDKKAYYLDDDELDEDSHKMTLGFIVAFLCLTLILL